MKPEDENKEKISAGKVSLIIISLVMVFFLVVLFFTEFLGTHFGKTIENVALAIIALGLGIYLYRLNRSK